MNIEFMFRVIEGIGLGIVIGSACFIVPFGLLLIARMLPWFIWGRQSKSDFIGDVPKMSNYPLKKCSYNKQVYIDNCHPSKVIKRLKSDGLQSLFINYRFAKTPVHQPNAFSDKNTPADFLNSANPIPIKDELNNPLHGGNLPRSKKHDNQKGTIPSLNFPIILSKVV